MASQVRQFFQNDAVNVFDAGTSNLVDTGRVITQDTVVVNPSSIKHFVWIRLADNLLRIFDIDLFDIKYLSPEFTSLSDVPAPLQTS